MDQHHAVARCRLLELPAEVRELIWIHAVTRRIRTGWSNRRKQLKYLEKQAVRIDRFNRPLPPAITVTCSQIRRETLPLYYKLNTFESWQPRYWLESWSNSALVEWLTVIGPERIGWLQDILLLCKFEDEIHFDIELALEHEGFNIRGITRKKQELTEYELRSENLGLPKHFGARGRRS